MKFMFIVAASVLAFAFSDRELPLAKMCCLREKHRTSMFGVDIRSLLKQKQIFLGLDAIFRRKLKGNRLFTTFPGLNERVVY